MFSRNNKKPKIDKEQLALFEEAKARVKQKKRLFQHFVLFLVGSVFLILANVVLGFGKDFYIFGIDWFVFAIVVWAFVFVVHFCRVWLLHTFMGPKWEAKELERLVAKQQKRIAALQEKVEKDYPLPETKEKKEMYLPGVEDEKPPLL